MLYLCPVGDLALAALTILLITSCCLSGRLHISSSILQFWSVLYLSWRFPSSSSKAWIWKEKEKKGKVYVINLFPSHHFKTNLRLWIMLTFFLSLRFCWVLCAKSDIFGLDFSLSCRLFSLFRSVSLYLMQPLHRMALLTFLPFLTLDFSEDMLWSRYCLQSFPCLPSTAPGQSFNLWISSKKFSTASFVSQVGQSNEVSLLFK